MVQSDLRYEFLHLLEKKANRLLFEIARLKGKEEAATDELSLRMKFQRIKQKIQTMEEHRGSRKVRREEAGGSYRHATPEATKVGQPDPGGGAGQV